MSNLINITKCDNELVLIAYQGGASFELARVLSGNGNTIDLKLDIDAGRYKKGVDADGINHSIVTKDKVSLKPGKYSLAVVGVNWGGPSDFEFTFIGQTFKSSQSDNEGVVWTPPAIGFTVA